MHDRLGERVGHFPTNQEELEEMVNARVPDEFILGEYPARCYGNFR